MNPIRTMLLIFVSLFATSLLAVENSPPQPGAKKLNVLFIMADDMRVELGCYGSQFGALTPNLDAFAKQAVRFDRAYCQFPLCCPSRSSLLTGQHPTHTGVLGNRTSIREVRPDWITLPQLFKENGYVSVRSGKIFHGGIDDPKAWTGVGSAAEEEEGDIKNLRSTPSGPRDPVLTPPPKENTQAANSDRFVVLGGDGRGRSDYPVADGTIANLRKYKDQPFFIGCGFVKPHSPPTAPQRFFDLYDLTNLKLPADFAPLPKAPDGFPAAAIRKRNADLFIGRSASETEAKEMIRAYIASISWVDFLFGRVMKELDELALRDKTIVVFVSDHGYQLGEKGKWSKAGSLFEMGTRAPVMISVPNGSGNGQACLHPIQFVDLYPTLVELCGLPLPPQPLEGKSLAKLLQSPQAEWKEPAYSVWSEDGTSLHGVAVRTDRWRYAEYGENGKNGAMLLDQENDPGELKNCASDPKYADVVNELSKLTRSYAAGLGK